MKKLKNLNAAIIFLILIISISCNNSSGQEDYSIRIKKLNNFVPGNFINEWNEIPSERLYSDATGNFPLPEDLKANLRLAWNDDNILLLIEIEDESTVNDTIHPWNADAIEIFLAPFRGSPDILQIEVVPGVSKNGSAFTTFLDHRKSPELRSIMPIIIANSNKINNTTFVEIQINAASTGIQTSAGKEFALQVYVNDADTGTNNKEQLQWFNTGHSYTSSFAMFPIVMTENEHRTMKGSSRVVISDEKTSKLYVFGASTGNKITVYNGNEFIFSKKSTTSEYYIPDSFDISSSLFDYNSDTLIVKIDDELTGFHELYFSPRRYITTENRPFDREIRNFVMLDRHFPPPSNSVLFVGSSSIRMWNSLYADFPELEIIHRGFGGSTAEDAVRYMEEIILPYNASTIVIYEGDNDVMRGYSGQKISNDIRKIIDRALSENSETRILILSPKPSISRMHVWDKYKAAQSALMQLAEEYENVEYVDVSGPMFDSKGKLKEEIFINDGVHMNEAGYAIWTEVLRNKLGLEK